MKMLCIASKGRMLKAGLIYTVVDQVVCRCGFKWYNLAELPERLRMILPGRCHSCRGMLPLIDRMYWRHYRFIPWRPDELGLTREHVNELYQPGPKVPIKEKQT